MQVFFLQTHLTPLIQIKEATRRGVAKRHNHRHSLI